MAASVAPVRPAVVLAREVLAAVAAGPAGPTQPVAADVGDPAAFRRDGPVWEIRFAGRTARLPDAKGLHDLAALLAAPDRELRSIDLADAAVVEPDTGPMLDGAARRSYERRIVALQAELAEAEDAHDQRGADRAWLEMEALLDQLAAATGIGGRGRNERIHPGAVPVRGRAADPGGADPDRPGDPELGAHLEHRWRTGARGSYRPDQRVRWLL